MGIAAGVRSRYLILRREVRLALRDASIAMRMCRRPLAVVAARLIGRGDTVLELRDGMRLTADDLRSLLPLIEEVLERGEYDTPGVAVRPGDVVVDIGAHVGTFCLAASRRGASRIVAYEPAPSNVDRLRMNLAANGVGDAVVHRAAVGGSDGRVTLLGRHRSVGHRVAEATRGARDAEPAATTVDVPCVSLATVLQENSLDHVDVLKMDCEGSEGAILKSATASDLARIDAIVLEYHEAWSELSSGEIIALLERAGFVTERTAYPGGDFGVIAAYRPVRWREGERAEQSTTTTSAGTFPR